MYPLTTPLEILRYPELGLADKARLALLTMRAKKMDTLPLDSVTAEDFIVSTSGNGCIRHSSNHSSAASSANAALKYQQPGW